MEPQSWQVLVGFICTVIFASSKVPMLLKALRTRDLRSYSLMHLSLSTGGNFLYWVYIIGLPPGPVWFLQAFFTVTDLSMLSLCLVQRRYPLPSRSGRRPDSIDSLS